jgi:hypothetical protein
MTRFAAIAIALFLATSALAQTMPVICQPHAKIATRLLEEYRETVVAHALAGESLLEVFASATGSWTVVITRPSMNNLACIQGTGTAFELTGNEFPPPKAAKSDPA